MDSLIRQLDAYVNGVLTRAARPFFVVVDDGLIVRERSGEAEVYGLQHLEVGMDASAPLAFLTGTVGETDRCTLLRFVETPVGGAADIHVVRLRDGWGLAYLDATDARERQRRSQQAANELALLGQRRERLLADLKSARAALELKNRELEEATRLKTLFMGRMSHEFRTPLSSILGYTELMLESEEKPDTRQKYLGAIQRGARYLLTLVDNLLDQARFENDELPLHPAVSDLNALVSDLDDMFRPVADQNGLSLSWWLGGDLPARVWLDEMRLRQVLVNLVGNAFKFTRAGGVEVELDWVQERLCVRVADTGPGIVPAVAESVFEPFHQGTGEDSGAKGAGLGLSISRALVRRMGGDLRLEQSAGNGARLSFEVDAPARTAIPAVEASPLRGASILVVDDDEDLLRLLDVFLATAGMNVLKARGGEDALRLYKQASPELALIDLQLGDLRGDELARDLRDAGYEGPLILMSAFDGETVDRLGALGSRVDFLPKPVKRSELLERLTVLLGNGG